MNSVIFHEKDTTTELGTHRNKWTPNYGHRLTFIGTILLHLVIPRTLPCIAICCWWMLASMYTSPSRWYCKGPPKMQNNRYFQWTINPSICWILVLFSGNLTMDGTPVSVELELRAYKDSTSKIAELLPESGSMDTMDVIILSGQLGWRWM